MVNMETVKRWAPASLLAIALVVDLLLLRSWVELATGTAACLERANFELISCLGAPPEWQAILLPAVAIVLAVLLGFTVARRSDPSSTQVESNVR